MIRRTWPAIGLCLLATSGEATLQGPPAGKDPTPRPADATDKTNANDGRRDFDFLIWSGATTDHPRWEQAFSPDGGQSGETNWVMEFTRALDKP